MQGLDLFCKLFVDPGDLRHGRVADVHERQRHRAVLQARLSSRSPSTTTAWTSTSSSDLVGEAGRTPKAIYTIPTFQNPSGVTLSLERRLPAARARAGWGSMVIDDDPYGLLRFAGEPLPTLQELGGGDPLVFSVRTFSKIVAPGLRVGWVDTVPELQPLLINAKQAMDTCTNLPAQRLLAGFLTGGHLDDHLVTQRAEYKRRKGGHAWRCASTSATSRGGPTPRAASSCWVTLDNGVDATALFERALAEGVAFIPGSAFSPSGRFTDALRLCFASTPPDRIHEGVARLRRAVDRLAKG